MGEVCAMEWCTAEKEEKAMVWGYSQRQTEVERRNNIRVRLGFDEDYI